MTKVCRQCETELPHHKFHRKADTKDGYNNTCADCIRKQRGQKKRLPPKPKGISQGVPITFEQLLEDVYEEERRQPHDWHIRHVATTLRNNPHTQSEAAADMLYTMWERRMRYQSPDAIEALDASTPVMNRSTERGRQKRSTSINPFVEYELL